MFADATNVFMSDCYLPELINKLNVELAKVGTWFKVNKLFFMLRTHTCTCTRSPDTV